MIIIYKYKIFFIKILGVILFFFLVFYVWFVFRIRKVVLFFVNLVVKYLFDLICLLIIVYIGCYFYNKLYRVFLGVCR